MKAGMGCQGEGVRGGNQRGINPALSPCRNGLFLLKDGDVEGGNRILSAADSLTQICEMCI